VVRETVRVVSEPEQGRSARRYSRGTLPG
jgi:hypothetical protein